MKKYTHFLLFTFNDGRSYALEQLSHPKGYAYNFLDADRSEVETFSCAEAASAFVGVASTAIDRDFPEYIGTYEITVKPLTELYDGFESPPLFLPKPRPFATVPELPPTRTRTRVAVVDVAVTEIVPVARIRVRVP